MLRPGTNGPRSLILTTTDRPLARFVTRTRLPRGSVVWAAVSAPPSNVSPLAVRRCSNPGPYHEATPTGPEPPGRCARSRRGAQPAAAAAAASASAALRRARRLLPSRDAVFPFTAQDRARQIRLRTPPAKRNVRVSVSRRGRGIR